MLEIMLEIEEELCWRRVELRRSWVFGPEQVNKEFVLVGIVLILKGSSSN